MSDDFGDLPLFAQSPTALQAALENVGKAVRPGPTPPIVQEAARVLSLYSKGMPLPTPEAMARPYADLAEYINKRMTPRDASAEAAAVIAPVVGNLEEKVFDAIRQAGPNGACCFELEAWLGMAHTTCSARITGLKKKGRIMPSVITRKTPAGVSAIAWVVA